MSDVARRIRIYYAQFLTLLAILAISSSVVASAQSAATRAPAPVTVDQAYRLGIADKVRVIVFNEDALSGEFLVSDSGTLSLPLIGEVRADGRTLSEVIRDVETKFAEGYLLNPRVSMDLLTYRPFYIMGEVTKPGEYPYSKGLTILNAIARAQGFTYRASKKKIFLKRAGEAVEQRLKLTPDLQVYPGDTVRVGERYF